MSKKFEDKKQEGRNPQSNTHLRRREKGKKEDVQYPTNLYGAKTTPSA
jgi:hypothetical protein